MAAAISKSGAFIGESRRRLFLSGKVWSVMNGWGSGSICSFAFHRRAVHVPPGANYEKNPDEPSQPVIDDELPPAVLNTYWAPHPETGVFCPSNDATPRIRSSPRTSAPSEEQSSALDQALWFRPPEADEAPRSDPS